MSDLPAIDEVDKILVNYVVGSRTYPLNMQRVTDEAKTALNRFYAEELLGLIDAMGGYRWTGQKQTNGALIPRAELRQVIKDKWLVNKNSPKAVNGRHAVSESICQLCGGVNPVWFAPNELWNSVAANDYHFLCPNCFIKLADPGLVWSIRPEDWLAGDE